MAKRKIPVQYRQKQMMERQIKERDKRPTPQKKKIDWKDFIKKLPRRIGKFFVDVYRELRRVTWPSRKALLTYTLVVVITLIFFAILLGVFDFIFLQLVDLLARI